MPVGSLYIIKSLRNLVYLQINRNIGFCIIFLGTVSSYYCNYIYEYLYSYYTESEKFFILIFTFYYDGINLLQIELRRGFNESCTSVHVFFLSKINNYNHIQLGATITRTTSNKQKMTRILIYFEGFEGNKRIFGSYNKNAARI